MIIRADHVTSLPIHTQKIFHCHLFFHSLFNLQCGHFPFLIQLVVESSHNVRGQRGKIFLRVHFSDTYLTTNLQSKSVNGNKLLFFWTRSSAQSLHITVVAILTSCRTGQVFIQTCTAEGKEIKPECLQET